MAERPARPERLSEMVAGAVGRRIVSGQYAPGDTLPTEPKIQREFGVSRTAVREAIRLLAAKGLTTSRPKIGTRVRATVDWNMLDPDVLSWQVDVNPTKEFIQALFEMRDIIEPAACAHAAERATEAELRSIGSALDGISNEPQASPAQIQADVDFHLRILDASRNPMLRSVGALIQSALAITFRMSWRAMREDAIIQHRQVYDAIVERNADEAFLAMRRLLRQSRGDVLDAIWHPRQEEQTTV